MSFIAVLGTTSYSDHRMPSTCPHRLKLVERWDSRSSTLFLSKSMLHSKGVDSGRTGSQVNVGTLVLTQGHGYTTKGGHLEESVSVGAFFLPLGPFVSYKDEPFVTWRTIS